MSPLLAPRTKITVVRSDRILRALTYGHGRRFIAYRHTDKQGGKIWGSLKRRDEGVTWALGWNTVDARALEVTIGLRRDPMKKPEQVYTYGSDYGTY